MSSTVVNDAGSGIPGASCRTTLGAKTVISPDRAIHQGASFVVLPVEPDAQAVAAFLPHEAFGQLVPPTDGGRTARNAKRDPRILDGGSGLTEPETIPAVVG